MLNKVLKKFKSSSFLQNAGLVALGTVTSQLLRVLLSPIITKLFSPEEFGVFMLYNSFISIASIIGTLRFEQAIPLTKNHSALINLLSLNLIISIITSTVFFISFFLFSQELIVYFNVDLENQSIWLFPLGLFISILFNIGIQWTIKEKRFKLNMNQNISSSVIQNTTQIGFGHAKLTSLGLISGNIIGKLIGSIITWYQILKSPNQFFPYLSTKRLVSTFKQYKQFPFLNLPTQLMIKTGLELPVFFINSGFGGAANVGQFTLANLIISGPVLLIGNAIGDVFYAESAQNALTNPKKVLNLSRNLTKNLFFLAIVPFGLIFFLSPILFPVIFGDEWKLAGEIAQIITFLGFFRLILITPVNRVFVSFNKHKNNLIVNIIRLIAVIGSFSFSIHLNFDIKQTLISYTFSMSIVYAVIYILANKVMLWQIKSLNQLR